MAGVPTEGGRAMDEREVKGQLQGAAASVQPSADLAERRRRVRGRVVAAAVAIALVGSGVAVAALIGGGSGEPSVVAPTSTTSLAPVAGTVDVRTIGSLTFIDAENGYGVESDRYLVRSVDGGRTWRRAGLVPDGDHYVMFAAEYAKSLTGLVAWGNGSLSQSSDGGAHWHSTLGPRVGAVVEASFRLWATVLCGPDVPALCSPRLVTSTDAGRTWTDSPTRLDLRTGAQAIAIPSGTTVYLVDGEFAWTPDGGRSWAHNPEPTECATRPAANLVVEADVLLLICSPNSLGDGVGSRAFVSRDEGHSWQPTAPLPAGNSVYGPAVSATDAGFLVATDQGVRATTDNGSTWHDAFSLPAGSPIATIDREFGVGVWVAAGDQGIWFSSDGVRWARQ